MKRQNDMRKHRGAASFLVSNKKSFWKEISKIRGRTTRIALSIDGYSTSSEIVNCFASKYKYLFNSVLTNNDEMQMLYNTVCCEYRENCKYVIIVTGHCHGILYNIVLKSINKLKTEKNDDYEGLTSDYFRQGTPLLYECISFVFTCMIKHSFAPSKFVISTIVPIHKGYNLKASESKNYRAVALSSLFSEILDNCILSMQSDSLQSDPLQFAYKENASTVQCVSVICEVINYYIHKDSCIYMCMLDASKTFDRVNHLSLFTKLKLRNMCPTILKFLMCTYQRQSVMVNWNGERSSIFSVGNGVKQGGVLSPVLFTVYLDGLINQLKKKGLGCHFNVHFVGCFIYADDITLLAPSRDALNNMLDVCRVFAEAYDILLNATKTKSMFFDRTYSTLFDKDIQFMPYRFC